MTGIPASGLPTPAARTWPAPTPGTGRTAAGGEHSVPASATAAVAAPATTGKDPAQVAHTAGVTTPSARDAFTSFLSGKTSSAAFWAATGSKAAAGTLPSPALAGVTFNEDGIPDFNAIVKAGGKVTGALPPDGQSVWTINFNGRRIVQYAVEIDRGDGSKPMLLKGVNVNCDSSVDRAGRQAALTDAAKMFADMADSLEEVRARCWAGRSAWTAPQRSLDVTA